MTVYGLLTKTSDIHIKGEKSSVREWGLNIHKMIIFYQNPLTWKG